MAASLCLNLSRSVEGNVMIFRMLGGQQTTVEAGQRSDDGGRGRLNSERISAAITFRVERTRCVSRLWPTGPRYRGGWEEVGRGGSVAGAGAAGLALAESSEVCNFIL
jgi:hypothetical protein